MNKTPLFNGKQEVTNEEVIKKMKYFIEKADTGMKLHETNKNESMQMAKEIRSELNLEYKNNDLSRIRKRYSEHELFEAFYKPAVHKALVSITGNLSYDKLYGFLYDVRDYMKSNMPSRYK